MRHFVIFLVSTMISMSLSAQDSIAVSGSVVDEVGNPIAGASLCTREGLLVCNAGNDGKFMVSLDRSVRFLVASAEGYLSRELEVDGSYLVFRMEAGREKAMAMKEQTSVAKSARNRQKDGDYDRNFRNRGLINSLEVGYGFQTSSGDLIYTNYGHRKYGNLNPIEVSYMIGWRISRTVSVSAGTGVIMNMTDLASYGDSFSEKTYGTVKYRNLDVPVFLNARVYFGRWNVQPMLSVSGGYCLMSKTLLADGGAGCVFRFGRRLNMYVLASVKTTPWPSFQGKAYEGYKASLTPGLKIGFML